MTFSAEAVVESSRFGEIAMRVLVRDPVTRLRYLVRDGIGASVPDAVVGAALRRIEWCLARGGYVQYEDVGQHPAGGISISVSRLEKRGGIFHLLNDQTNSFAFLWRGVVFETCELPAKESLVERFLAGQADPPMRRHICGAEVEPGRNYCDHCQSIIPKVEIR